MYDRNTLFVFRPVAEPKHRNVSAELKQISNVTMSTSECYIKLFITRLILYWLKMTILIIFQQNLKIFLIHSLFELHFAMILL